MANRVGNIPSRVRIQITVRLSSLFPVSPTRVVFGAAVIFRLGAGGVDAQMRYPGPIVTGDDTRNENRNILDEHPLTARPPSNDLRPKLIFFPPNPPPLNVPINLRDDREITGGAPDALAPYVTEPFYAPLSSLISPVVTGYQGGETMSDDEQRLLADFTRERADLLAELRQTVAKLAYTNPPQRLEPYIALAEKQTPRLVALEKQAEELRARLAKKANWNEFREWRLAGERPPNAAGPGMIFEREVMRAAVFYFDGLSPAQRRLLREVAIELEDSAFVRPEVRSASGQFIFFQPETARIPKPTTLPLPAARLWRAFLDDKGHLKDELRDTVYAADSSRSTRRLHELADAQAPRIAALEQTAEDLRAAFARIPDFPRTPPPPALPAYLTDRIARYQQARKEILDRTGKDDDDALQPILGELAGIRSSIELIPGVVVQDGAAVDAFLNTFLAQRRQAAAYYEYDIAVYEPGLSPEQRRLLYSGAIEALQLPLPGAEQQPISAPGTVLH